MNVIASDICDIVSHPGQDIFLRLEEETTDRMLVQIVSFLQSLCPLFFTFIILVFRLSVGLLGQLISPSQNLYLHWASQRRKTRTNILASSEVRTHDAVSIQVTKTPP